jgi:ABC-type proline/glycine betaine transport system substrate-binding protein
VKRIGVCLASAALLAFSAGAANAGSPSQAAQIKALQRQVTTLQKQVRLLTNALEENYAYDQCQTAISADVFQWTWVYVDKLGFPFFQGGVTPQADDKQSCREINVPRPAVTDQVTPTQAIFQNLINWIG